MARLPGFELLGHPQHVIIRGNNRQIIFLPVLGEIILPFLRVGRGLVLSAKYSNLPPQGEGMSSFNLRGEE